MKRLAFLAGTAALLAAAHGAGWAWSVHQVEAEFGRWTEARRAEGWTVSAGATVRGGWPLAAELRVPRLSLADAGGAHSWTGDVALRVALSDPGTLRIKPEGEQHVRLGDTSAELAADDARVTVALDRPDAFHIAATGLRVRGRWGELTAASLEGRVTSLGAVLAAREIGLPLRLDGPGRVVAAASLDAALSAPVPPGPTMAQRLLRWTDADGAVQVRHVAVRWGELAVEGAGTASLDAALQPRAEATLRLRGHSAALDSLEAAGALPAGGTLMARTVLGLMAEPVAGGGETVEIPLRLQDGLLAMGQIPLLRLPPVSWPAR